MTHLGYTVTAPLNIPADCFSDKGVAVLLVTGGAYDGHWVMNALPIFLEGGISDQPCGSIETDPADRQPDRTLTAVRAWMDDYCEGTPFAVTLFKPLNDRYGPAEAPFFSSAQVAIALPVR